MIPTTLGALAVVLALAAPARAEGGWPLSLALGGYMTLNGADTAQTLYCLGQASCRESNRVLAVFADHPATFGAVKIGLNSAAVYGIVRLHQQHPRLAWVLVSVGLAVETYATVHNAPYIHSGSRR
jgi:hypothetical protein